MEGIASKRRDVSVEENLRIFKEEMTNATDIVHNLHPHLLYPN